MDIPSEILYHATKNLFGRLRICLRAICCIPIDLIIPAELKTPVVRKTTGTLVVKRTKKLYFHINPKPRLIHENSRNRNELGTGDIIPRRMDIVKRKAKKYKGCLLFKRYNEFVPKKSLKALKWRKNAIIMLGKQSNTTPEEVNVENSDKKWESLVVLNKDEKATEN